MYVKKPNTFTLKRKADLPLLRARNEMPLEDDATRRTNQIITAVHIFPPSRHPSHPFSACFDLLTPGRQQGRFRAGQPPAGRQDRAVQAGSSAKLAAMLKGEHSSSSTKQEDAEQKIMWTDFALLRSLKMEETKVIYYIDDEETPYLVKLPVATDKVTLADFKNVLNRDRLSYKFFFKSQDDDFG